MLSQHDFKQLVKNAPLFAIDLVILNPQKQILIGKRVNEPAKDAWFVPGGRIFKNEPLAQAFERIVEAEIGLSLRYNQASLIGLFDHFYGNSFFGDDITTHYINATHLVKIEIENCWLPKAQHQAYRWGGLDEIEEDSTVHQYSKVFMAALKKMLGT